MKAVVYHGPYNVRADNSPLRPDPVTVLTP